MSNSSTRPYSSFSGVSSSGESLNLLRTSFSRKASSVFTGITLASKHTTLVDDGKLDGKIKVHSVIKNSDYCTSVNYRLDGRFYAVSLANGGVNVYSSKTNNILYTLNSEDKDLPYAGVSATCVRFRPFNVQGTDSPPFASLGKTVLEIGRRKSYGSTGTESEHFLPPISNSTSLSIQSQQYVQRRRKSSVSALGLRSSELLALVSGTGDANPQSKLVTASFTNGSVKTFNFLTEECINEMKEDREILTLAYNKSGSILATGGSDGKIYLYDSETGSVKAEYNPPFEYDSKFLRTYSITFHPTSEDEFIVGGWSKKIQFFDARVPNLIVGFVEGPKVTGEGIAFNPTGNEFCVAARDRKRCIEVFNYGERRSLGNIMENLERSSVRKSTSHGKETPTGSLFYYSARYLDPNFIAFCGSHPGSIEIINRNLKKGTQVSQSITGLENSVNCIDNFRKKLIFIVQNEVACAEIFE